MLTEAQKALLAFIGTGGKTPDELDGFPHAESDVRTLMEAGYVVLNRNTVPEAGSLAEDGDESFFSYALTSAGIFEIPQR
jgi:hypothetical protein